VTGRISRKKTGKRKNLTVLKELEWFCQNFYNFSTQQKQKNFQMTSLKITQKILAGGHSRFKPIN